MRRTILISLLLLTNLIAAATAQAVVVNLGGAGSFGVALVPGTNRSADHIPTVPAAAPCSDPWLSGDLGGPTLPQAGLCYHGGSVVHSAETFDLAWDPLRRDWSTTRNYVEAFLRHIADASNALSSPYAVVTQYRDSTGKTGNASLYGGGCIDYGQTGGASCQLGTANPTGAGMDYPASGCPVTGTNQFDQAANGTIQSVPNDVCLTDAQIKTELTTEVTQAGILGHTHAGYTPVVVLMTPAGVVDCLDAAGQLCSSNAAVTAPLPSVQAADTGGSVAPGTYTVKITYVTAGGQSVASGPQAVTVPAPSGTPAPPPSATITIASPPPVPGVTGWYAYVAPTTTSGYYLQQPSGTPTPIGQDLTLKAVSTAQSAVPPLSASSEFCSYHSSITVGGVRVPYVVQPWTAWTGCDEPGLPKTDPASDVGQRLVNPLSQAQIAALVNPGLDGWSGLDGSEINDNGYPQGCGPLGTPSDNATLGPASYVLQHEFNNGGVLEQDPNAPGCAGGVALVPQFVVPSSVDPGDAVEFDGSKTVSTLVVPRAGYLWNFGDGHTGVGPSLVHSYASGGTYTVTLTVTDRGGNVASLSQQITVVGPAAPPVPLSLQSGLRLVPQSLRSVLHSGMIVRITTNQQADGLISLEIPSTAARRAHLWAGHGRVVTVGRGTLSGLRSGTHTLHIRIPSAVGRKLLPLRHLTFTLRVTLMAAGHLHRTIDAAGRY